MKPVSFIFTYLLHFPISRLWSGFLNIRSIYPSTHHTSVHFKPSKIHMPDTVGLAVQYCGRWLAVARSKTVSTPRPVTGMCFNECERASIERTNEPSEVCEEWKGLFYFWGSKYTWFIDGIWKIWLVVSYSCLISTRWTERKGMDFSDTVRYTDLAVEFYLPTQLRYVLGRFPGNRMMNW